MCEPSELEANAFDKAEDVQSASYDSFDDLYDSRETVDTAVAKSQYTLGRIPEVCELCIAPGDRNAAVKFCTACKKQICTSCVDTQKHLEACDPRHREIVPIVKDAADGKYTTGRIPDLCDLCIAVGEREVAAKYCLSCEKHICTSCVDAHKRFKALMRHSIVDTEPQKSNYQLRSIRCEQHKKNDLAIFCITHNCLCSVKCADVKHSECALTTNIAAMESGSRKAIASVKQKYQKIETYMEGLRERNVKNNDDFKKEIKHRIRHLEKQKRDIESVLEFMQMNCSVRYEQLLGFQERTVNSNIEKIEKVKNFCRARVKSIDNMLEAYRPNQIAAMKSIVIADYLEAESDIDNEDIAEESLLCSFPLLSELQKIQEELIEMGNERISIFREKTDVTRCENVVSVLHGRKFIRTNRHKVRLVRNCSPTYNGICALSGGKQLALSDCCEESVDCGNVCLYDINNKSHIKLKLNRPFGIAELRSDSFSIAATLPLDRQILIISTSENCLKTVKTFQTGKIPLSLVSLDSGYLGATFASPPSFDLIDLHGQLIKTMKSYTKDSKGRIFRSFEYVAVDEFRSHIIQPCQENNAVYSFNYSGNPVFEYRDSELRGPQGVSLDKEGNVYVCSFYNRMIHVLTPTGIRIRCITEDVPIYPQSICFDDSGERFWLSNTAVGKSDTLYLFTLQ